MRLILDIGSGRSLSDQATVKKVIDTVAAINTGKHEIIFKTQLFVDIPPNVPLDHKVFSFAYRYANKLGYKLTSSVFDEVSTYHLMQFDVPFIKIRGTPEYRDLIGLIPRRIPVYVSNYSSKDCNCVPMACVIKYPALLEDYMAIPWIAQYDAISDHTEGWDLMALLRPKILEKHFCLERTPDNPDAGAAACTPKDLEEIL